MSVEGTRLEILKCVCKNLTWFYMGYKHGNCLPRVSVETLYDYE